MPARFQELTAGRGFVGRLETGSDLESLFLELTRSEEADHEGTFFGLAGGGTKTDGGAR